jgi:hypothetical protein
MFQKPSKSHSAQCLIPGCSICRFRVIQKQVFVGQGIGQRRITDSPEDIGWDKAHLKARKFRLE